MKHTDFYNICTEIEERSLQELIKAIKAHGGVYIFDTEPRNEPMDYVPIVRAEDDNGTFNFRVTSVAVDDKDEIIINGIDLSCNECTESEGNNIVTGDLAYIIEAIPPVGNIDEVKVCPLKVGQEIYWRDPDHGRSSGFYKVNEIPEHWNEETPIWISDEYTITEVTINELWARLSI